MTSIRDKKGDASDDAIRLSTRVVVRVVLILLAIALLAWVLYGLRTILLLLILSIFFCYLIAPIVRFFENPIYLGGRELKLPRGLAIFLVYVLFGGVLYLAGQLIVPVIGQQASTLFKEMPDYIAKWSASAQQTIKGANTAIQGLKVPGASENDLAKWINDSASEMLPRIRDAVAVVLSYLVYLPWLVLVPVLSFFMLKDAENFANGLVALLPSQRLQRRANRLLIDISKTLAAYIRAQITSCLIVGTIVTAGFMIIGVPYAAVIGAIAGVMEFIPMIGPLIAIVVAFLLALTTSFKLGLGVLLFLVVLRMLQDYVIYPRVIGHGIRMHPLMVILAILCGAELGGVVGIFLAIPLVGLFQVGYHHYIAYKRTVMLGISDTGELTVPSGISGINPDTAPATDQSS